VLFASFRQFGLQTFLVWVGREVQSTTNAICAGGSVRQHACARVTKGGSHSSLSHNAVTSTVAPVWARTDSTPGAARFIARRTQGPRLGDVGPSLPGWAGRGVKPTRNCRRCRFAGTRVAHRSTWLNPQ